MARQFLRQNNLHNVVGRIEYIRGDTGKQENMMAYLLITKLIANTVFKLNCTHN